MEFNVEHVAKLARIGMTKADKEKFSQELKKILDFVAELNKVDTSNIEPIAHATGITDSTREDKENQSWDKSTKELILNQVPETKDGFIKVKAIFDR
ncbi:Asp-tRNA(Asn)/Glu-tRNA(Gln) amidotransferase subunit GatC [Candidatus Parcubacteria bacterium]|nr:MAG: Asp-tRNA(Asn)/Glu-tRNA(Gln) amidotransferase subunit GatC [Candidatus Parcubacteria bacterium]